MAQPRIKSSVISQETFLQAMVVSLKNEYTETPAIRAIVCAPEGYDVGAKLYGMSIQGILEKKASPTSGGNVYRVTAKGKKKLQANLSKVQVFGSYDVVTVDSDQKPAAIMGGAYSSVADAAMTELAEIIEKNARLKNTIATIVNQIDMALGE